MMYTILEIFAVSAVLLLGYKVLLERRTSFLWSRLYLLALPPLSVAIPLLDIPLWGEKVSSVLSQVSLGGGEAMPAVELSEVVVTGGVDIHLVALLLYILGVVVIVAMMLRELLSILKLHQGAESLNTARSIRVVRCDDKISSFSFLRTIYISRETSEQDLRVVLLHEQSHIEHLHSYERLFMELWKAILWWNPFVWSASRLLTEVEEFEADRDVLNSGESRKNYIETIFKQMFGYTPEIASALKDSLTKKRFIMMTTSKESRYARLRLLAVVPMILLLVTIFGTRAMATTVEEPESVEAVSPIQDGDESVIKADQMPTFQGGGIQNFQIWVMSNVKYPAEAVQRGIQGTVILTFIIEKDGTVNPELVTVMRSPDELLTNEAMRVLKSSPKWVPGYDKGKPVRVKYTIPIKFQL